MPRLNPVYVDLSMAYMDNFLIYCSGYESDDTDAEAILRKEFAGLPAGQKVFITIIDGSTYELRYNPDDEPVKDIAKALRGEEEDSDEEDRGDGDSEEGDSEEEEEYEDKYVRIERLYPMKKMIKLMYIVTNV